MNKAEVNTAPDRTSFQPILTSGSTLKITPNNTVITIKLMTTLRTLNTTTVTSGRNVFNLSLTASSAPLITSDTSNKKPSEIINEPDSKRSLINFNQAFFGLAFTCQMILMDSWISPNTV